MPESTYLLALQGIAFFWGRRGVASSMSSSIGFGWTLSRPSTVVTRVKHRFVGMITFQFSAMYCFVVAAVPARPDLVPGMP